MDNKNAFALGIVSLAPYETIQSNFYHSIRFPLQARPKILFVEANSPEEKAGLKVGDIINSINGDLMFSGTDTLNKLLSLKINEQIKMDIIRGGKIFKTTYTPDRAKQYNTLPKRMVFQHDIPLLANQYGGPVCFINGTFAGISLDYATPSGNYAIKPKDCATIAKSLIKKWTQDRASK
ncbi:PDZ domain-containing protein [Lentisphaera profundi]|uniref:PDZ domain-containing protein n=1 Tax=Lentisphaera profundi TaxID=1658616 RepID=A0ABY7VNE2_9BACT|nr:PDZ domain-containing protein [Lentisphaera profundi]WDE95625.1 PDZ domain-containing protein [Lentisphaera profundi]